MTFEEAMEAERQRRQQMAAPSTFEEAMTLERNRRREGERSPMARGLERTVEAGGRRASEGLSGFYKRAGEFLGLASGTVGFAFEQALDAAGVKEAPSHDEAVRRANAGIQKFMQSVGLTDPEAAKTFMGQLGKEAFNGALGFGAVASGAKALSQLPQKGGKILGRVTDIARDTGEFFRRAPAQALAGEVGGAVGAGAAERLVGAPTGDEGLLGKVGRATAPVAGAIAGGATAMPLVRAGEAAARGVGQTVKQVGRDVGEALGIGPRQQAGAPGPEDPIRPRGANTEQPFIEARRFYDQELDRIEQDMARIVQSVGGAPSTPEGSAAVKQALDDAATLARAQEDKYWRRVALGQSTRANSTMDYINNTLPKIAAEDEEAIPQQLVDRILRFAAHEGSDQPKNVKTRVLRILRTQLRNARWTEQTGEGGTRLPYEPRLSVLRELENRLLNDMEAGFRNDTQRRKFQEARAFSDELNSRFTRGPVAAVLARRQRTGGVRTQPEETVQSVLATDRFSTGRAAESVGEAADFVQPFAPGAAQNVRLEMEQTVRAMFREVAEADPTKGPAWLRQNARRVKSLASALTDIQRVSDQLSEAIASKLSLSRSVLGKFTKEGVSVEARVRNLFASATGPADATKLKQAMGGNRDAVEGLQAATLDALLARGGDSPLRVKGLLENPEVAGVLDAILTPEQLSGLRRFTAVGAQIEGGSERGTRILLPIGRIAAGVAGARLGTQVSGVLGGTGNIQTPGIFANAFRNVFDSAVARIPIRDLYKAAILDPAAGRLLLHRAPTTISEIKALSSKINRVIAAQQALMERYNNDTE